MHTWDVVGKQSGRRGRRPLQSLPLGGRGTTKWWTERILFCLNFLRTSNARPYSGALRHTSSLFTIHSFTDSRGRNPYYIRREQAPALQWRIAPHLFTLLYSLLTISPPALHHNPAKQDFIALAISSRSDFIHLWWISLFYPSHVTFSLFTTNTPAVKIVALI